MKWLIACERSGIVRDALRARGIEAYSCDTKPSRRPSPWHIQCDVREILWYDWDGMIAHPVCRYMANSGVRWLHEQPGRWDLMLQGCEFYRLFQQATHIKKRAIENPVWHRYAMEQLGRPKRHFRHPYHFGDPFQKLTGFELYGLAPLVPTHHKTDYSKGEIKQEVWLMSPGEDREEKRSETKPGMAAAFAEQWGLAA